MANIGNFGNGSTIGVSMLSTSGKSCSVDASASKAAFLSEVYTEGAVVKSSGCVVVSGLTYCVGLLLQCSNNRLVACHFNGGHESSSEWKKIEAKLSGETLLTAVVITNTGATSDDVRMLREGVEALGAQKVLYYTPSTQAVRVALFGDGTFGELAQSGSGSKGCCVIM